jgi:hypothetical protein
MLALINFVVFKKLKVFQKPKTKKTLPPCGTAVRTCRHAARRQGPGAALPALAQEPVSCRHAPWRQGLNAVGYGDRSLSPCGTVPDVHLSKILIGPFIFRKS